MENIIAGAVLLIILGLAAWYVVKAKKSGQKCIDCPHARECAAKNSGSSCGCGNGEV